MMVDPDIRTVSEDGGTTVCSTMWRGVSEISKKRIRHSAECKRRWALEAVKSVQVLRQVAKDFQVHPIRITICLYRFRREEQN